MKFFCLSVSLRDMKIDHYQKQSIRGVLRKMCSEKMQQIYRRTPMSKCDLLNLQFDMGVLLKICSIFSEHPFIRTPLDSCFFCIPTLQNQFFILCESKLNLIHNGWLFPKYVLFVFCLLHFEPSLHYFHWYVVFSYWKYLIAI